MVQVDIPAAFVCSQVFAWSGRRWLVDEPPSWLGRYTAIAFAYAAAVVGACGLYLFAGWPEWEVMYWFEPIRMDTANFGNPLLALVAPLFIVVTGLAGGGGFLLAHRWARAGKPRRILAALWIGVAFILGMFLLNPAAPMFVGRYYDYHAYLREAVASARPLDYGVLMLGPWTFGIPWAAQQALLDKHHLITYFSAPFFVPVLIDLVVFFVPTVALARWFGRPQRIQAAAKVPLSL